MNALLFDRLTLALTTPSTLFKLASTLEAQDAQVIPSTRRVVFLDATS